jgi:CHAT domain-containing protein
MGPVDTASAARRVRAAAAFQLAGYRHVIGTLWAITDREGAEFADRIYSILIDSGDVADAVHTAVRRLRDRRATKPSAWGSHIHVGA